MQKLFIPAWARARRCAVLLAALAAGCKDAAAPRPEVGTVVVTGVPATPLLVGGTVQLIANPVDHHGAALSGEAVAWSSSDTLVATVSRSGLVSAVGAGPAVITAEARGKQGAAALDVRAGGDVGLAGGTVSAPGGAAALFVPRAALPGQTTLMLRPAPSPPADPRMAGGTAWEVSPAGTAFQSPATLTLRYDPSRVPAGIGVETMRLHALLDGAWVPVRGSIVNVEAGTVAGPIRAGGVFAAISTPTAQVVLSGALLDGALYTGQTGTVGAVPLDVHGDTLRGRPLAWTTSDASRATVDGAGTVTAVGAGPVVITATSDGTSASTSLTILARPAASWSQTAEWATFQGNARHTGAIAATVDPVAFRHLWTATVLGSSQALNPVATGGGRVFASTSLGGAQKMVALDARTGAEAWSRPFGNIHSLHPPAYGNGRVYVTTGGHGDSYLWSFDAATGTQQFRSAYGNQWSSWYAPVVTASAVFMAGGSYGGMYRFNAQTGAQGWFFQTNQYDEWVPAFADGRVYAYTGSYSPRLDVVDAATGAALYSIGDPHFSWQGWSMDVAPVLGSANNVLATQAGRLLSFDLAGRRVGWERQSAFTGTPSLANGVIYVINDGRVEARAEGDGALLWSWTPPAGQARAPMVVTRNMLFVSAGASTYGVDLAARRHTWSYPAAGHLAVSADGILFIARGAGRLTAIDLR